MSADGTTADRCRFKDLCIDACDGPAMTRFWAATLGWEAHHHDDGSGCVRVDGAARIWVNVVPEPTSAKNRLHLDVCAESLDTVLAGGAVVIDEQPRWTVLKDPDGQEFCVFLRDAPVGDRAGEAYRHAIEPRQCPDETSERTEQPPRWLSDGSLNANLRGEEGSPLVQHRGLDTRPADVDGERPCLARRLGVTRRALETLANGRGAGLAAAPASR